MEPVFPLCTESKSSNRLIALHESHNDIGANQNQSLYYTKGCNDLVRLRKSGCCNIGERGGHGQANLDNCCGDSD